MDAALQKQMEESFSCYAKGNAESHKVENITGGFSAKQWQS